MAIDKVPEIADIKNRGHKIEAAGGYKSGADPVHPFAKTLNILDGERR
jgi:hypothetical protein